MRKRKASTTPPGIGAATKDVHIALRRFLKSTSQSIDVLRRLLISDPAAAVLPLDDGQSVLIFAMRQKCSLEVLRVLLAHGAQPEQVDALGRNALSALAAMSLPFAYGELPPMPSGGPFGNVGGSSPCGMLARLHVSYAVDVPVCLKGEAPRHCTWILCGLSGGCVTAVTVAAALCRTPGKVIGVVADSGVPGSGEALQLRHVQRGCIVIPSLVDRCPLTFQMLVVKHGMFLAQTG